MIEIPSIDSFIAPAYYEPWNDIISGSAKEAMFPGGRYSGKSTFLARVIVACLSSRGFENCHAVAFRKHQVDLRESVYTEIELAINALGLSSLWETKKSPLAIIRKDTGQTISFNGLDDPKKHKSKKPPFGYVRFLWFEELDEFQAYEDIESVQISYQRGIADSVFQTLCSYNPPRSSANWVNAEAVKRKPGRKVYHTDYRDLLEIGCIPEQVLEQIEDCRKTRNEIYRHTYLGEVTGTGGEIFTNVKDAKFSDEQVAEFRRLASYGMDFGIVNDPTVLEGTYYDSDKDYLYIFEEWTKKHPYFTDVYEGLKQHHLEHSDNIIADTAPAGWIQNINMLGARLHPCYKAEDWVETSVSWLRNRTRIVIDSERCPLAWQEFIHYEYDTYKDGTPKERLPDRDNHTIDAVRYSQEHNIKASARKRFVGAPVAIGRKY